MIVWLIILVLWLLCNVSIYVIDEQQQFIHEIWDEMQRRTAERDQARARLDEIEKTRQHGA